MRCIPPKMHAYKMHILEMYAYWDILLSDACSVRYTPMKIHAPEVRTL